MKAQGFTLPVAGEEEDALAEQVAPADYLRAATGLDYPRRGAGPSFLAMLLFDKYGQQQPLHRQAERFAREGVPLSVSTLAPTRSARPVLL